MAVAAANFYRGAAATSNTTLYTAPSNIIVTEILIANTASSDATATISLNGVAVIPGVSVPANGIVRVSMKQYVASGQLISGLASATTVNFHISGVTGA